MRKICLILWLCVGALGVEEKLEVSAKSFQSDLKKGVTELNGEVVVVKGGDKLWADKVIIQTDKKNQPQKYTAIGNVRFHTKMPDKEMKGKAAKAIYDALKDEYQLIDNAIIEEVGKQNTIKGNIIVFNPKTQEAFIKGSNQKPGMITFIMESKDKTSE
ncbi:lipopolysaccharide transport periplasmic protein LptA [Helicobacter jaachi]|uniref:Lipopolysaccharide transport periplasmic protein LptA n=1 Tax=Helicobacter jaachi TaxID=1677920 RepID=A0A4U8TBH3_9HELI|nr:lipopolysaccharide transport periplasmic protein LptA [Helicobacter jaachi]TLD97251.1 lipopolysaccharide transport periplasmic protein LptA [Helicobacter jaachi]